MYVVARICMYMYVCICMYTYVCICMYVYVWKCMYIYVYVCMYMYVVTRICSLHKCSGLLTHMTPLTDTRRHSALVTCRDWDYIFSITHFCPTYYSWFRTALPSARMPPLTEEFWICKMATIRIFNVHACVYIYVCKCTHIYLDVCMYLYMPVYVLEESSPLTRLTHYFQYMYAYIHIYIYTCIHMY
jgi:hypothetical protein